MIQGGWTRILVGFLVFTATCMSYILRVSFNMAVVTMTDMNDTEKNMYCNNQSDTTLSFENSEGLTRFCWTQSQQGLLKSAFFIGYVLLQVHGGSLAEKFGTKIVLGFICVLLPSVLTLLTPIATAWNFWALFTIRILIGLAESATFPSLPPLVSRWVPEEERSMFIACTYVGGSFGTVIVFPLCGWILDKLDWEAVFYITGAMGAGWYFFWFFLVSDEPKNHRCIRQAEIQYIETNRPKIQAQSGIPPYFLILKCPAVWTIMACDFANGWGLFVLLNDGPTFVDKVLNQDISSNGLFNALPPLANMISSFILGYLADLMLRKQYLTKPWVCKIWQTIGFVAVGSSLGLIGFFTEDVAICIAIMTAGYGLRGGIYAGHIKSVLDLTTKYHGTVYGFSNGFGSIAGFLAPLVTGWITEDDPTDPAKWRIVFFIPMGLYTLALLNYLINAKFEPQSFDYATNKNKKQEN